MLKRLSLTQRTTRNVLTLSWKVDEFKPLEAGIFANESTWGPPASSLCESGQVQLAFTKHDWPEGTKEG
jgi:hypothetical protein